MDKLDKDELLALWVDADEKLKQYKKTEDELRMKLVRLLCGAVPDVGTHDFLIAGVELKIKVGETLSAEESEITLHKDELTDADKAALKWKAGVDKRKYDKLPKDSILRLEVVTKKRSKPSITIVSKEEDTPPWL